MTHDSSTHTSTHVSPSVAYEHLSHLDTVDVATGASYRQEAQDVLADPDVSLKEREAIAERLNEANHQLELQTVVSDESY